MDMEEKKIDGEVIFDGHVVKLHLDKVKCPNGNIASREIVVHNGGAAILYINDNDEVLLERQYRYAYNEVIYEIPAGKLEKGENPKLAAIRELEEETGLKVNDLIHLGDVYPTCGYSSEIIHIYLAENPTKTHTNFDEDEVIDVCYIKLDKVKGMILSGEIKDAKTICAINYYLLRKKS